MFDIHTMRAAAFSIALDAGTFRLLESNSAAADVFGGSTAFRPGAALSDVLPSDLAAVVADRCRTCLAKGVASVVSFPAFGAQTVGGHMTLVPVSGAAGRRAAIFAICSRHDASADLPSLALDTLDGGFWTLDLDTRCFKTSKALAEKIAGPGHQSLNMAEYVSFIHAGDLSLNLPDGESEVTIEFRIFTFEGRMRWLRTRRRPIRDASGRPTHVVGIVLDITDEKLERMRLEKQAVTDELTLVANRRAFEQAATRCFGNRDRPWDTDDEGSAGRFGVIVIDLDGFKQINDAHGHRAGDGVLCEVGRRLAAFEKPGDLFSRIGGDEFALLLPDASPRQITDLMLQIETAFTAPFSVEGSEIMLGASCGSALRCGSDRSVGDVVARADRALYAVKDQRRRLIA